MRFLTCFSDFHLVKSKTLLFVLFFLCRCTFYSKTSHKNTLVLCVFHFVAEKTRTTTINRYAFVERAQKSVFLSDLYQIFSFFSKTIRYSNIAENTQISDLIRSDQNQTINFILCQNLQKASNGLTKSILNTLPNGQCPC